MLQKATSNVPNPLKFSFNQTQKTNKSLSKNKKMKFNFLKKYYYIDELKNLSKKTSEQSQQKMVSMSIFNQSNAKKKLSRKKKLSHNSKIQFQSVY